MTLHADSRALSMMGARALLDMVMQDKVGDIGGFAQKLDALVEQGFISSKNRDVLRAALDVGHAAAHRGHRATSDQVSHVMDIVENLLHTDVIAESAKSLAASTPARRPRQPK